MVPISILQSIKGIKSMICQNCQHNQKGTTEPWWCDVCCYLNTPNRADFNIYLEDSTNAESHQLKNNKKLSQRMSLLRYVGGKSKLVNFVAAKIKTKTLISPFVGGGSVEFALLYHGFIDKLIINDLDFGLYTLYHVVLNKPDDLIQALTSATITRQTAQEFKNIILNKNYTITDVDLALAYLLNNRLSFSGIYNANLMGGKLGSTKDLTQRLNIKALTDKIHKINSLKDKIELYNMDAITFIEEQYWNPDATLLIDPPYVKASIVDLYQYSFDYNQHYQFMALLNNLWLEFPDPSIILFYDKALLDLNLEMYGDIEILPRKFSMAKS